jgi:hypothetical protein
MERPITHGQRYGNRQQSGTVNSKGMNVRPRPRSYSDRTISATTWQIPPIVTQNPHSCSIDTTGPLIGSPASRLRTM